MNFFCYSTFSTFDLFTQKLRKDIKASGHPSIPASRHPGILASVVKTVVVTLADTDSKRLAGGKFNHKHTAVDYVMSEKQNYLASLPFI